ncbi:hypothetical protein HMN09_00794800 [Mycena chlorophos]|uniref:Uncharacterized protein n=1 Tax=Mycena chlorophos TaxID=658473 RepID=A0A8H6WAM3_MYCCL|nr:hypothetical protein HMN09_00794800 [Mycena chlorophos]
MPSTSSPSTEMDYSPIASLNTTSSTTSFAPVGESTADLVVEQSFLDGFALGSIGYGVLIVLTWQTLYSFLSLPRGKTPWGLTIYAAVLFGLATIGYGSATRINEEAFIDDRDAPGGPAGWEVISFASGVNMMGVIAYVVLSWLADGLVLWRFWLIWGSKYGYLIVPASMLLGSVVSSLALIVTSFKLADSFWAALSVQFGTAYWSLSIALNILLTVLITARILVIRRRIKRSLGLQHAQRYFSAIAMLVESASLYAAFGLVFIVAYAKGSEVQNWIFPPLGQVQVSFLEFVDKRSRDSPTCPSRQAIAPMLILSRVAQGRALSQSNIQAPTSTINLTNGNPVSVGADGGRGSTTHIPLGTIGTRHERTNTESLSAVKIHIVRDEHTDRESVSDKMSPV